MSDLSVVVTSTKKAVPIGGRIESSPAKVGLVRDSRKVIGASGKHEIVEVL